MFQFTENTSTTKRPKKPEQCFSLGSESRRYQFFFVLCLAASLLLLGALPTIGEWLRDSQTSDSLVKVNADTAAKETAFAESLAGGEIYAGVEELPLLEFTDWIKHTDPIVTFELAVPLTWQRQLVVDQDELAAQNYTGYAVTYQSPLTSDDDVFSDYIMIEMLAEDKAGFVTDGSWQAPILIDGRSATWERVALDDHDVGGDSLDLVAYQLLREEPGFSLGIYVVGETKEEERLREIFTIVIDSFAFPVFGKGV